MIRTGALYHKYHYVNVIRPSSVAVRPSSLPNGKSTVSTNLPHFCSSPKVHVWTLENTSHPALSFSLHLSCLSVFTSHHIITINVNFNLSINISIMSSKSVH